MPVTSRKTQRSKVRDKHRRADASSAILLGVLCTFALALTCSSLPITCRQRRKAMDIVAMRRSFMSSCVSELVCVSCGEVVSADRRVDDLPRLRAGRRHSRHSASTWTACAPRGRPSRSPAGRSTTGGMRELLPLDPAAIPQRWPVGWTPILDLARLARELGVRQLLLKDEGRNPTASFKDRASSVGVAHALQARRDDDRQRLDRQRGHQPRRPRGARRPAGDDLRAAQRRRTRSSPNSWSSARPCSRCRAVRRCLSTLLRGLRAVRLVQSQLRDQPRAGRRQKNVRPGRSPSNLPTRGGVPDWVAVSVGDGCTIAGIWKGLAEMHALGVIDRLPRLLGVQAADVDPIEYALEHDELPQGSRRHDDRRQHRRRTCRATGERP